MLTIWGRADSSNVSIVMWAIGELGLPYQRHDVGHRFGGTDDAAFVAMNPNRMVPVLKDGDSEPLWESAAILRYLANRYAPEPFWPTGPLARANVDRWAEWAKVNVVLNFAAPIFVPMIFKAPEGRDPAAIQAAIKTLSKNLALAEERLSTRPYLCGDDLTLADIQLGGMLYRYFTLDIERPDLPALSAYYERLCARPAYAEHIMVSYDALRPR